jgi:hypothetical protein
MADKTRWTPGPWECGSRLIIGPVGSAGVGPIIAETIDDMTIGNARLIAAAPDMAEALGGDPDMPEAINPLGWLKSMIDFCNEPRIQTIIAADEDPSALWEMIREVEELHRRGVAALAKARGEGK